MAWFSTHGDDSSSANGPHWDHLLEALEAKRPGSEEEYRQAAPELRPSFIYVSSPNTTTIILR